MQAMAERYQARLMAALMAAEEAIHSLSFRGREAVNLAHGLRHMFDNINDHARTLGYGLVTMLVERATDLVAAMARNPAAAMRCHADTARVLATLATAMKRIAQNRMEGDGGEGGFKLLQKIDRIVDPVRSGLG